MGWRGKNIQCWDIRLPNRTRSQGGGVLRTQNAAQCFELLFETLCPWLFLCQAYSLCCFLSGSSAFLLSFQDSELLGNSSLELKFSLWWAASMQGKGVWWSLWLQVSVQKGRQQQPSPFTPPHLLGRGSWSSGQGRQSHAWVVCPFPIISPSPSSYRYNFLESRNHIFLVWRLCCLTECPLTWIIQFLISLAVAPAAILLGTANLNMYPRLNLSKVFVDPLGRSNIGLIAGRIGAMQELAEGTCRR